MRTKIIKFKKKIFFLIFRLFVGTSPTSVLKRGPRRKSNNKGPKQVWATMDKVIFLRDILNPSNKTPILNKGQWTLTIHNVKKVYIPKVEKQEM